MVEFVAEIVAEKTDSDILVEVLLVAPPITPPILQYVDAVAEDWVKMFPVDFSFSKKYVVSEVEVGL